MVVFDRSNRVSVGSVFLGKVFLYFFVGVRLVVSPSGRLNGVDNILSRE